MIADLYIAASRQHRAGRLAHAKALCEQILAVQALHSDALHLLGVIERQLGQHNTAIELIRRAISIQALPRYYHDLGNVYYQLKNYADATACYQSAVGLAPNFAMAQADLGNSLFQTGEIESAVVAYQQALALRPRLAGVHSNLGLALTDLGQLDQAIDHCRLAIALKPDLADGHNHLGLALLLRGQFAEGWVHHEWRRLLDGVRAESSRFDRPPWRGAPLNGAQILLHAEQGVGDTVQFARYAPLVAARGGRVVLEVQPALKRLMGGISGAECVISKGEPALYEGEHCPLLSLPFAFGTELTTIPSEVPYLLPNPAEVRTWRERLKTREGLRVGLVWAGQAEHRRDRDRSISLTDFAPLSTVHGASFYSLQKGPPAAQIASPPGGLVLQDIAPALGDFADTAAAIAALDLVITVDTSVAHVAGAIGSPVWILLPHVPDWRWLIGREDSPWYPSARLFRQPAPGAWDPVIERVTAELHVLAKSHG